MLKGPQGQMKQFSFLLYTLAWFMEQIKQGFWAALCSSLL